MNLNRVRIRKEMKERGLSVRALALKMRVKRQGVYQVLQPGYGGVTLKTVEKIAKALGVDPKELLT